MQTANIMLDIGGDRGNQVPKHVTAAEIAVLIAIHGDEAVHDISPAGDIQRSNRDELNRLREIYGRATDGESKRVIDSLFPGAAARVYETLPELGLPEAFYKATARAVATEPEPAPEAAPARDPLDHDGDGKKGGSKAGRKAKKADTEPASEPAEPAAEAAASSDEGDDEVTDMFN